MDKIENNNDVNSLLRAIGLMAATPDEALVEAIIDVQTVIVANIKEKEIARRLYMDAAVLGMAASIQLGANLARPVDEVLAGFNQCFENGWAVIHKDDSGLNNEVQEDMFKTVKSNEPLTPEDFRGDDFEGYNPFNTINS